MPDLKAALDYIEKHKSTFLAQYKELLRIPSISTLPERREDVHRTAAWVAEELRRLNMDPVEIIPTAGHPIVYGEWLQATGRPTVLVYGHYDVQPVDPIEEWESDPFGAEIRGDYIYARGASDMKGQFLAQLKAVEALRQLGPLPVNLKYLFEGEEEIGSPNLEAFLLREKDRLNCNVVINCDGSGHSQDIPALVYALRGLTYFELEVQGPAHDLHSGLFGGSVRNPIHVLCELIAGMHDADGRVTLPGFYDKVRPLDDDERELLAEIPMTDEEWLGMTGALAAFGEKGYSTIERVGARPTIEVNGIWGGFTGEGAKTVLPARARAKISARLVADQDHNEIYGQLKTYLEAHMPEDIRWNLIEHSKGPGAIMDRKSLYMQAATAALARVFGLEPVFVRMGGSVPVVALMQQILGADSIMLGFELPDDNIHGPNERQYLPNFYRGIETHVRFLAGL